MEKTDEAKGDPVRVVVRKLDADTGKASPQGDGTLAGAEFTLKWYKGEHTLAGLPARADRTWVVKTGENGTFDLQDDFPTHKVSGDEWFIKDSLPYIPLGTLTVAETSAPQGYLVDADVKLYTVTDDDIGNGGREVNVFNAKLDPSDEAVRRAGLTVVKRDVQTGEPA